jgi:hypothetical protein
VSHYLIADYQEDFTEIIKDALTYQCKVGTFNCPGQTLHLTIVAPSARPRSASPLFLPSLLPPRPRTRPPVVLQAFVFLTSRATDVSHLLVQGADAGLFTGLTSMFFNQVRLPTQHTPITATHFASSS